MTAAWLEGNWAAPDGATEHWISLGGALFGVGFPSEGPPFEVMIISTSSAGAVLTSWPGGGGGVRFQELMRGESEIRFGNSAHDFPKEIGYSRSGDSLSAFIGPGNGVHAADYSWKRGAAVSAPALEQADRDLSKARTPRFSGFNARGDLGFTAGEKTSGGYVTIWRKQDGGIWEVWFDVGI